jgi:uncharacterized repeat protein (TIGR02543 family)
LPSFKQKPSLDLFIPERAIFTQWVIGLLKKYKNNGSDFMKAVSMLCVFIILFGCSPSENSSHDDITYEWPIIYFDTNGGQFEDEAILKPEQLVLQGHGQETPVRKDFIFSHWNSEKDGSGGSMTFINSSRYGSEEDITMYAQWTPLDGDFNVIFEARVYEELKIIKNLNKGTVIELPNNNDFTMESYTLSGWVDPEVGILYTDKYTVKKR